MTGGIEEVWEPFKMTDIEKKNLWPILYQGFKKNSILTLDNDVIYFGKNLFIIKLSFYTFLGSKWRRNAKQWYSKWSW
jgi:hypothetical protein